MPYITVNGEKRLIDRELTLLELLDQMDIKVREVGLAVAVNGEVVPKSMYKERVIKEGDSVEIVQLVGGG
jgi:sulfur carrier protein